MKVRPAVFADGMWYPSRGERLREEVVHLLSAADPPPLAGEVVGLVSPHAGYTYSGRGAAYAYKVLEGRSYSRVVVLAPSHRASFHGAALCDYTHFETPLGRVAVDVEVVERLAEMEGFVLSNRIHDPEHSLEVQLPFLQVVLGEFRLVPVVVGELSGEDYKSLARGLREAVPEGTLLVASSDFTHYGHSFGYVPFAGNVRENLKALDGGAIEKILALDREGFTDYVERTGATICGMKPIGLLLEILRSLGGVKGVLLNYYTSGDVTGDWSHVVAYASIAFITG